MVLIDAELAKNQLADLVERAKAGEEIIISKNGKPVARFMNLSEGWQGKFWDTPELDTPDPGFVVRWPQE